MSVPSPDTLQPIRLGATIYPMHALRLRLQRSLFPEPDEAPRYPAERLPLARFSSSANCST